ncbi:MAG: hypothetical protein FWD98_02225 [Defluviitaleaceae bacterium]|nr:hypothetical protein [Defluviitaleaceae bacterium]
MGMSDMQFQAYLNSQLRVLEGVREELSQNGFTSVKLEQMIADLEQQLSRP